MTTNKLTDEQLAYLAKNLFACGFEVSAPQVLAMVIELQERRKADSAEPIGCIVESVYEGVNGRDIDYYESDLKGLPIGTKVYAAPQPSPDSEAQATLKRLAVILHGSEVDLNLLTVTAQSLMDRCKAGYSSVTTE